MTVKCCDQAEDRILRFAVIIARSGGKWVFCKHRERDTLEIPGGRREPGEDIGWTAVRELREALPGVPVYLHPAGGRHLLRGYGQLLL